MRALALFALAAVIGSLTIPGAFAVEAPDASVFAIQTNGPNGLVTLGDWYTSNVAGAGAGYHYVRFTVPCGWPTGLPVHVDLFSPEMNRVSGALAQSEEPNGAYDSTQFELYGPGATIGPGYASPGPGTGIPGTRTTFQPGAAGVAESWVRYATLPAPVACGNYVVRSEVLTSDPFNPAGTGDDQNGWRIRVGSDTDGDPTNPPPANYDDPDGIPGTNDELSLGVDQASFQQDSGALACQTFFEYVSPGQPSIVFNNFDMDGNTRVRYYAPSDASYDPNANAGGVLGTLSGNGVWNGGTLANRVGDTITNPESGWWRFVTCISSQNQFIQEGEAGRAAYYTQPPTPLLTIAKTDGLATAAPGQTITYTIDVHNIASGATAGAADNVVVHDVLPSGVTYLGCGSPVPAQGTWTCSHSGGDVTFTQDGWIDAGDAAQLTVTARVDQGASGSIVNLSTADYTDQIGNPFPQASASDTDVLAPSADLTIAKTDGLATVTAGTSTTYAITLTNQGPSDEPPGAVITDAIPSGVTGSQSEADCAIAAGTLTCTTSSVLAVGASVIYHLTLTVPPDTVLATLTNTATIASSPVPDPDPSNDVSTDLDAVAVSADLSITKTDSADPVDPGTAFDYTLGVTNNGPSAASGLTVSDTVPSVFAITSATSAAGACGWAGNVVTCTRPALAAGAAWSITISVGVDPLAPGGLYTDTATVTATSPDPVPGNDAASEGTLVTPVVDLALTKSDGVISVAPGTSTTYAIVVTNLGPSDVPAGAVMSDVVPVGTIGSESEPDCAIVAGTFTCTTSAVLSAGASVTYHLTLAIDAAYPGATLVNTAHVSSPTVTDPFPANDSASDTDAIDAIAADLSVVKTDSADPVLPEDPFSYAIVVSNAGPDAARNVALTDTVPPSLSVSGVTSSGAGVCAAAGNAIVCSIDPLAPGATWTITVQVVVPAGAAPGTVTNTATVSGTGDTDPSNDTASQTTTIAEAGGTADLTVTKSVDDASPLEGQTLTYTVSVSNAGPADATGVEVVEALPAGLTFVSASATHGAYDPASGAWSVGALAVGETAELTIRARVDSGTAGTTVTNRAYVSALDQDDPTPGDEAATVPVVVGAIRHPQGGDPNGGGVDPSGGTAFTGLPGGAGLIVWMFGLALVGLFALATGARRPSAALSSIDHRRLRDAEPEGRFLDAPEPFFFEVPRQ